MQIAGSELPSVPLLIRIALSFALPALPLANLPWLAAYSKDPNPWLTYGITSFSQTLLLVKIYEQVLLVCKRCGRLRYTQSVSMKSILLFFFAISCAMMIPPSLFAQVTDSTVCDILANPQSFEGKIVRIKGMVVAGFEEFTINGTGCGHAVNAIWLAYPEGTKAKAGPVATLRLQLAKNHPAAVSTVTRGAVTLDKNKDFKNFDNLLSTPVKVSGLCLGCVKYSVEATLVGRLDGTKDSGFIRDASGRVIRLDGFGHLNRYRARLVLQSVSDITPREIDYTNGKAAPEDRSFVPGAVTADQVKRGADAFGGPGEDNGVNVGFGNASEVASDDAAKSTANSPDGLIFNVTFDGDRLKGVAMQIALAHIGTHIADLRSASLPIATLPPYGSEFRALQTSLLSAPTFKVKALTLSGGYQLFSQSWSETELGKNANDAIFGFLENWASLKSLSK